MRWFTEIRQNKGRRIRRQFRILRLEKVEERKLLTLT